MPNGLNVEKTLFERLEAVGFRLAPYHETADQEHKVDRVILGPPPIDSPFWVKPAMAVQVTLKPSQWQKMWIFQQAARRIAPRIVYLEFVLDGGPTDEVARIVAAAFLQLYYDMDAPINALVQAADNGYRLVDLDRALKPYNEWLSIVISGDIKGRINHWRPSDQYGFAYGEVRGPDGEPEMPFFFHQSEVMDPQLREILGKFDGDIPIEDQPIILFNDAGAATDYPRKAIKRLRLANPPATATAQPASPATPPAEQVALPTV